MCRSLFLIIGKGTYKWKENGAIYDGDWKRGKRNGFGTYSVPNKGGGYRKEYSGGWKNDMRHVSNECKQTVCLSLCFDLTIFFLVIYRCEN
jgi:hypothetical protein